MSKLDRFMPGVITAFFSILIALMLVSLAVADTASDRTTIEAMKEAPRGPFRRIRWFCHDGEVLPPKPYACSDHGGGVQHGELSAQTERLRDAGYLIANVLVAIDPQAFFRADNWRVELGQLLMERFLINHDDGWIFRGARSYRGALQAENEAEAARQLLNGLLATAGKDNQDFLLERETARLLLPLYQSDDINTIRQLAGGISETDISFLAIRSKIHNQPDAADAKRVRDYARQQGITQLHEDYERLASTIEQTYARRDISEYLREYALYLDGKDGETWLGDGLEALAGSDNDEMRLRHIATLLRELRNHYPGIATAASRAVALQLSLRLEQEAYVVVSRLADDSEMASRAQKLKWLGSLLAVSYGSALISEREWQAADQVLSSLGPDYIPLGRYREELAYLNRVSGWAAGWFKFHFQASISKLAEIEPLTWRFIPDRMRSTPLLAYGRILDSLLRDAQALSGVQHQLFGEKIGVGLRALNPGLSRGVLEVSDRGDSDYDSNSIVLLPETTADLSPVAGILTMGEGNALSHVQLLAANLGIPNVVISPDLETLLEPMNKQTVVMAVSPGGVVRLEQDSQAWQEYFSRQIIPTQGEIILDIKKLDLQHQKLMPLAQLRASDAGRIAGPKAANLGELKYHYPQAVTSGLLVPFGVFREHLNQPYEGTDSSVFEWMQSQYRRIDHLQQEQKDEAYQSFLEQLSRWIKGSDLGQGLRQRLKLGLQQVFGAGDSYMVFVRSDTNVEDLPGFTGAGLNLTLPNVKGFENIINAIQRVWASPFTERAFAWRQKRMIQPEHVYPSVLLMKSVEVDKSGVMLTLDTGTGRKDSLSIAANQGIGGAVQGEQAEELLIRLESGEMRLLADATAATKRVLNTQGGLIKVPLEADGRVLSNSDIERLTGFARDLAIQFPQLDESGAPTAADVEFGFMEGELVLFQVRPYLKNRRLKKSAYLNQLDHSLDKSQAIVVDLHAVSGEK